MALVSYLISSFILIILLKLLSLSLDIIFKVVVNLLFGAFILKLLSVTGVITVSLTWWMTAIVGILGVPGAILVAIISYFLY